MNWTIKFIDGTTLEITDEEYKAFIQQDGFITLKRNGRSFNKSSVSQILSTLDYLEEKKSKMDGIGILHDGKKVIKAFGKWYLEDSVYVGDDGKPHYTECFFDYDYYPELMTDEVKSPIEYQKWLPTKKEIPYLSGRIDYPKLRENNGFTKLI